MGTFSPLRFPQLVHNQQLDPEFRTICQRNFGLAQETGQPNVGITIDTGHAFVGGEVVSESIVLAKRHGDRLFHMHFNDNHVTTDDDMIVGTVNRDAQDLQK